MGVVSINEIGGRALQVGEAPNESCTRKYQILSDIRNDTEENIRSQPDLLGNFLPAIFAPHPVNPFLRCTAVDLEQPDRDDGFLWHASIRWSYMVFKRRSRGQPSDPSQRQENPLLRPAIFKWGNEPYQRSTQHDLDNKPFKNSAGDWFDPPIMFDDNRPTFTITKNVPGPWNAITWIEAHDVVNSAPFLGLPTGSVKLKSVTGDESFEAGIYFYTKVATFHLAEATNYHRDALGARDGNPDWKIRIPDRGFHELFGDELRPITLADGQRPSVPIDLDGTGRVQEEGEFNSPIEFRVYDNYDFSTLSLGL